VIDPALTFRADYSKMEGRDQKVLKRWTAGDQHWDVTIGLRNASL
jgi:hypothetical protein